MFTDARILDIQTASSYLIRAHRKLMYFLFIFYGIQFDTQVCLSIKNNYLYITGFYYVQWEPT